MKKLILVGVGVVGLASVLSVAVASDTARANNDGKAFANSINNSKIKDLGKNVDPNSVPNYQGENVPERQYYNSGINIENQAQSHAASDPNAQYINGARSTRPGITINSETDPLFKRHEEITLKSKGLTDTYSGCVDLPVGTQDVTRYEDKTCNVSGQQDTVNFTCQRNLDVSCSNENAGQPNPFLSTDFELSGDSMPRGVSGNEFWFGAKNDFRNGRCKFYYSYIKFYVSDLNTVPEFLATELEYDDWLDVAVNGHLVFRGIGNMQDVNLNGSYKCEWGSNFRASNVDLKPRLQVGWNTIQLTNLVSGGGGAFMKIRARRIHGCTQTSSYNFSCPAGETHTRGNLINTTCTSGAETRYIKGFPVYKSCWQWDMGYSRLGEPYFVKDAMCGQLESQGCGQTNATCTSHNGVFCENQVITYRCPYQTAERSVSMCGSQLVCPDGNCTSEYGQTYQPATEAFKDAATSLAVAEEIAKEFDQDNLTIFTGDDKSCKKKAAGFANCCKDSGWGTDIGLASCSNEEKELGLLKEASRVHYVGNYCSQDSIFGCITRKYVYCTYPSKLSRIIIEQGKAQLGKNYGTAESPNCSGFTLQEIESLNFDSMDLSEFYSDVMSNAANGTTPNSSGAAQDIQEKLKARFPQIGNGGN